MSATPRRFKVEPVETTSRSSRDKDGRNMVKKNSRDTFAEEWASKSTKNNRDGHLHQVLSKSSRDKFAEEWAAQTAQSKEKRPPRKFVPQLIETAKRSRRVGDSLLPPTRTGSGAGGDGRRKFGNRTSPSPPAPNNTPTTDFSNNPLFLEIKRATSPISIRRPRSFSSMRSHHSYCVPTLDPIESSESEPEDSSPPSPSTSPSAASDHSYMEATRIRESVDARYSGYLLELAAKAAEKQLRAQALAAFPNENYHEPVDHFVDRDMEEAELQSEEDKRRRESTMEEARLELLVMQRHREKIEKEQEAGRERKKRHEAELNKAEKPSPTPWGNAAIACPVQCDSELDRMRKEARPPMLGEDIQFPRCSSPEPARFDTTQGCDAVRKAMCYLTEQQSQAEEKGESLWCGNSTGHKNPSTRPSLYSPSTRPPSLYSAPSISRPPSRQGLWAGCCVTSGQTPPRGPSGLLTPRIEVDGVPSPCPTPSRNLMPPTPPPFGGDFASVHEKLIAQVKIEEEFNDDFVTQIYNYLSLGYPSIARVFDEELSRVSNFSIAELRQDDHLPTSKGYIRLGEDGNLADSDVTEESCMRWRALRTYVRVWAKQQPNMAADNTASIGIAARKGSWAV